jgi:siroheme synthase
MPTHTANPQLAREAKAIVALAFRNGPIEKVHSGRLCPTCGARPEYSRITDDEIKAIMKSSVDRMHALLRLKNGDPDGYARQIDFGARYVAQWDEPEEPGV